MFRFVSKPRNNPGFTLFEIVITTILLGALLTVIVPVSKRAVDQRRRMELRRASLLEVSNVLERLLVDHESWPEVNEERELPLRPEFAARLRDPRLVVRNVRLEDPASDARRFDAALTWAEPTGGRSSPVRLSAFSFEREDAEGGEL